MEFKIGDKVRLSENSRFFGNFENPNIIHIIGEVISHHNGLFDTRVKWYDNDYENKDLIKTLIPNLKIIPHQL